MQDAHPTSPASTTPATAPSGPSTWSALRAIGRRVLTEEKGAEGLEKLLIIAAIVLPLLVVLLVFRDTISSWVQGEWEDVADHGDLNPTFTDPSN